MLRDDNYLYIAAEMEEPHLWGELTAHDSVIYHENDFEVFIDPDGILRSQNLGAIFGEILPSGIAAADLAGAAVAAADLEERGDS